MKSSCLPFSRVWWRRLLENALAAADISTTGDVLAKLEEGGDEALLEIKGFGHKGLIDLKRRMRSRGYDLPETDEE
ncbi:MAG: hypothetical protein P8Z40_17790 [Chloroflexota bacterium]